MMLFMHFMRPMLVVATVTVLSTAAGTGPTAHAAEDSTQDDRPNILIVLLDDLGFSDFGCHGGEIRTPHVDRLANEGLRFSQFYNAARCCPTRAALLTGLYPHQVGLRYNGRSLTRDGATLAELLGGAGGYQTAMTGKWHLSKTPVLKQNHLKWVNHQLDPGLPFGPLETYPVRRGFDRHYGIIWGVINYFDPFSLVEGTEPVAEVPDDFYLTDAITDKSIEYLRAMARVPRPFFLYVAHCAPHWPLHARPEDIERYRETYRGGWHEMRQTRYRRQIEMGLFDRETTPLPKLHGTGPDWDALSDEQRAWESDNMAVHAAMVDRVDQGLGRILQTLDETGRRDNTIIFILADNGASPERYRQPGYDRPSHTRDGRPIRYDGLVQPGGQTSYSYVGSWWANALNTPFRYWKKESFEGGCHTPLIVHWPRGPSRPAGSITPTVGHVIDIVPTCLDLAKIENPANIEGRSLLPVFRGEDVSPDRTLFFEHVGGRAVRERDWKLVALPGGPWELYDLSSDRTETRNVAARYPDRVARMTRLWQAWAQRMGM